MNISADIPPFQEIKFKDIPFKDIPSKLDYPFHVEAFVQAKRCVNGINAYIKATNDPSYVRKRAFPMMVSFMLLTLVGRVASVAEITFKGFANVLGSPFSKQCKLGNGLKQLFLYLPLTCFSAVATIPLSLIIVPVYGTAISIMPEVGVQLTWESLQKATRLEEF